MRNFIKKTENFYKIEFWAATTILVFSVFFHITDAVSGDWLTDRKYYGKPSVPFNYFFISKIVRYIVLYLAFLVLNFIVVQKLINKETIARNVFLLIITYVFVSITFGITDTYLKHYLFNTTKSVQSVHNLIFRDSFLFSLWLLMVFGFYTVIKYSGLLLVAKSESIREKYKFVTPGGIVAFNLWLIVLFMLIANVSERELIAAWAVIVPFGIAFYWYAFHTLIPISLTKKNPFRSYLLRAFALLLLSLIPIGLIAFSLSGEEDAGVGISTFNAAFHFFITAPFSWLIYKRYLKGNEEIYDLKKELGQSNASFDFLRSQINPHFLFNALNTIYGTAIQEKAERTSEGIEKLGDMMRFMLQENMQEKISLSREVDYLNNYISLQKLRTDPNPNITIDTHIEEKVHTIQIAPMLLIPFVENAFKHGISFREKSLIKITLEIKDKKLYFDVSNSKHSKLDNDPEKDRSGIGLNNVKQRLQLLYKNKHELMIRETAKDFYVHLTLQLS